MAEMKLKNQFLNLAVIVAALGYFVDIYDLLLFTIVREPSLMGINVTKCPFWVYFALFYCQFRNWVRANS
jgi:hypothetical protein